MTVLSTRQLCAGYGSVPVLFDVDIDVKEGESVSIIGTNGAGKSTLVRAICGLVPCMKGRILKDNLPIEKLPAHRRADLGIAVVLEGRHLFGELSVESNLRLAEAKGAERTGTRFEYSVDEVLDLLMSLAGHDITVIMIEHIMQAVMRFSERVMCLDAGKIIAIGTPTEVMANQRVQEAYLGT